MKILWHSRATHDLRNIIAYIASQSSENAVKVLNLFIELTNSLTLFPYKYPKEPFYNKENIRFLSKWSYKIIYRVDRDTIIILRIFNTKQHPERIFG